jgi:hypothetical protein
MRKTRGPEAVRGTRKDTPTDPGAGTKTTQETWKSRRTDIALSIDERGHAHQKQTNEIENQPYTIEDVTREHTGT